MIVVCPNMSKCYMENVVHFCKDCEYWPLLVQENLSGPCWNKVHDLLAEAILPLIPQEEILWDLFSKWCSLGPEERKHVELAHCERRLANERRLHQRRRMYRQMGHRLSRQQHWCRPTTVDLPLALNKSLILWEHLQDTQGAPGYDDESYAFTCDRGLLRELRCAVNELEWVFDMVPTSSALSSPGAGDTASVCR